MSDLSFPTARIRGAKELLGRSTNRPVELDRTDLRLLRELQHNNKLTNVELAERAYLTPPTCLRRVRRLREAKVIIGDISLVDPEKIGPTLTAFIEASLERNTSEMRRRFENDMLRSPQVMLCYRVSGAADFMLMVQVADMCAYHEFLDDVLSKDSNVKAVRSTIAIKRLKFRTGVNLEEW